MIEMDKRYTDTKIWEYRWFKKLSPEYKLAYLYIKDKCDHAGIWEIDVVDMIDNIGIDSFDIDDFVEKVNTDFNRVTGEKVNKERLIIQDNDLVITGFLMFQYATKNGTVSNNHMIGRHAIDILRSKGLLEMFIERNYAIFSSELPEHRAKHIKKSSSTQEKKKKELNEQASYLNIMVNVEEWESRLSDETKLKRIEIMRDEMKQSSTAIVAARKILEIDDEKRIMKVIDWFFDIIMGNEHYLKPFKEVRSYFINKINYAKKQIQDGDKQTGTDKQLDAIKKYIQ